MCTHSTDLCSICFCFVLSISIILSDVEAQMSVVHPTQSTGETPFWRSTEQDIFNLSCYPADKSEKRRGRGCAVFLLCAVLLHYASCDLNMYCILKKKKKRVDVRVRQRDKCISPDVLTQSAVSEDFLQTERGRKKMLHCNRIVNFFPTKRAVRNAFGPCLLLLLTRFIFGASI